MDAQQVCMALAAPFGADEINWKPQAVKGNKALAVAYIDARLVQDRLDAVLGVDGWQDEYQPLDGGCVMCRLSIRVGGAWVTKCDVGGESEQPDGGDRHKAAFSDALKRAAVKVGVGRYIYSLPLQWCDYDPQSRRFTGTPKLPAWALPTPAPKPVTAAVATTKPKDDPRPIHARAAELEASMVKAGRCEPGELFEFLAEKGDGLGPIDKWPADAAEKVKGWVAEFQRLHPAKESSNTIVI